MSKVLPILFNTDMVRAILDGRKMVTRRLGRWKIRKFSIDKHGIVTATMARGTKRGKVVRHFASGTIREFINVFSDYQPGDILYVRETWCKDNYRYMYMADYSDTEKFYQDGKEITVKWRPSIHMPKEAARIWLKVTNVRVERLQEITEEQAKAEGIGEEWAMSWWKPKYNDPDSGGYPRYRDTFANDLWNSTIKKSDLDRYGWDANPWVWRIEFEQCEKPGPR